MNNFFNNTSYIIQAPAGSGKTTLLINRFLFLLSQVEKNPEEILTITFTNKASEEIKKKVIKIIESFKLNEKNNISKDIHNIIKKIIAKDIEHKWDILNNTNRLNIMTIDCFCNKFIKYFFNYKNRNIEKYPQYLYEKSINSFLLYLDNNINCQYHKDFKKILNYFNNDFNNLKKMFIKALENRNTWLVYLSNIEKKKDNYYYLLKLLRKEKLEKCKILISNILKKYNIYLDKKLNAQYIINIYNILYNKIGKKRNRIIKKDIKNNFLELHEKKETILYEIFHNNYISKNIRHYYNLPKIYSAQEWSLICSISNILILLTAHLKIEFNKNNKIDFSEIIINAVEYINKKKYLNEFFIRESNIKHIIVDEFQDTSIEQFQIIKYIINQWENIQNSVFLVGDPMQSIYSFRNAEVFLFLYVINKGIGIIKPTYIFLNTNYRSNNYLLNWYNYIFKKIFPNDNDADINQIKYYPAITKNMKKDYNIFSKDNKGIFYYNYNIQEEYIQYIKDIINDKKNINKTIGILFRSRNHIKNIIHSFKKYNISFYSKDIEYLKDQIEIQDIISLSSILINPFDKLSWIAFLRSPLIGIKLDDIVNICNKHHKSLSFLESLIKNHFFLSKDAQNRISIILPIFLNYFKKKFFNIFSIHLQIIWKKLGGDHVYKKQSHNENIKLFFSVIKTIEKEEIQIIDIDIIKKRINMLFANISIDNAKKNIFITTIHKAKGLEFDIVILPDIHKSILKEEKKLFYFLKTFKNFTEFSSIISLYPKKENFKYLYNFIEEFNEKKCFNEMIRLFYVASTRAKESLHLIFKYSKKIRKFSFLYLIKDIIDKNIFLKKTKYVAIKNSTTHNFNKRISINSLKYLANDNIKDNIKHFSINKEDTVFNMILFYTIRCYSEYNIIIDVEKKIKSILVSKKLSEYYCKKIQKILYNMKNEFHGNWILSNNSIIMNKYFYNSKKLKKFFSYYYKIFIENNIIWIIQYIINKKKYNKEKFFSYRKNILLKTKNLLKNKKNIIKYGIYFLENNIFLKL